MARGNEAYGNVNRRWKAACRAIFGKEIGELEEYKQWLCRDKRPVLRGKSGISGNEVVCSYPYAKGGKLVAFDEVDFFKKGTPLKDSELSGLGSIALAMRGRATYCGNIVLGNSMNVKDCTSMVDCLDAYGSEQFAFSKGMGYACEGTYNESAFGCNGLGYSSFIIRGFGVYKSSRCLELSRCDACSDCHFSHGLSNCRDCLFCFNLKNARHCVGNAQLSPPEYAKAKARIFGEIVARLEKDRELPSLNEIAEGAKPDFSALRGESGKVKLEDKGKTDKGRIERAFQETTAIVLGKRHEGIDDYGAWLSEYSIGLTQAKSCASGAGLQLPEYSNYMKFPGDRLLSMEEADALGERLWLRKEEAMGLSLANAGKALAGIAFFSPEWKIGKRMNIIDSPLNIDSTDCYRSILAIESKCCAHSYIARNAENVFGVYYSRLSSFVLRCSQSVKLSRCFECDSCRDCTDCYFCHNCENVHDSMFCFNAKNLRYAIGNAEMPREKYMEVKKRVLDGINRRLEKRHGLNVGIFTLGRG